MLGDITKFRNAAGAFLLGMAFVFAGCGGKEPASPAADATSPATAPATSETAAAPQSLERTETTWTPEAMEELLAPVALYPDVVLGQVLIASTNPQEVLDAGNWILQNQNLQGKALDKAAEQAGFTPPVRGLLQFTQVIDMLCSELGWTAELGQAYVNDQAGVLDAVQRLRAQAKDVGNLVSSEQMTVSTEVQEGQEIISVSPPSPQVVYVPQYDPVAAYAPAPPVTPAPVTTTVVEDKGHSTGTLVATGLLAFGAGLIVANAFDDDDDYYHGGYYYPRYYGPPPPYYSPYPYRPRYGNGYYPSHGYNRPPNYQHGFNNNNVNINVNQNNNYWNNYGDKPGANRNSRSARSPITAAKPNRRELDSLNAKAKEGPKRPAPSQQDSWKGQGTYAGAKQPDAKRTAAKSDARGQPKVQGSYAGAKPKAPGATANKVASAKPQIKQAAPSLNRPDAKPAAGTNRPAAAADRGRPSPQSSKPQNRPAAAPSRAPERPSKSAVSGADRGGADRAASQRGKQSMPSGVPAKAKGGGGKRKDK